MPLLNYTTQVGVGKTLGEIQEMLVKAGARSILVKYAADGMPLAIKFLVPTQFGELGYSLPANIDAVWQTLVRQGNNGQVQPRFTKRDQAQRVGWRIIKDWMEAQLAIIETGMVTIDQVMLPYQTMGNDRSLYDVLAEQQFKLLPESSAESAR